MINIKKRCIGEGIYLLEFDTQYALTSTLLRFEESYESPEYKGNIFTLSEFKRWYSKSKVLSHTIMTGMGSIFLHLS